jgi:NAD(P)-dependent dehydrogenase (short-subunit alcohol dehydrogenase family)
LDLAIRGRRALVSGASKGIGRACAERLAAEGCHLHLAARTETELEIAAKEIRARYGVEVSIHPCDLSNSAQLNDLFASCADVDIVVNNAGAIPGGSILAIDEPTWRAAWDLKVFGYINLCRLAFDAMSKRQSGVIINVIGAAGDKPTFDYIAGSAGNASLMALTKALGATSRKHGVRVVAINPGLIKTDRLITLARAKADEFLGDAERWEETLDQEFPPGEPEHIADMVAFLASDRSSYTTGTVLTIDGGSSAR